MIHITTNAAFDHARFGHAWRTKPIEKDPGGPFAVVNLGISYIGLSSSLEAREIARAFIEAAAALARLEADPELGNVLELADDVRVAIGDAVIFTAAAATVDVDGHTTASAVALREAARLASLTDQELIAEQIDAESGGAAPATA